VTEWTIHMARPSGKSITNAIERRYCFHRQSAFVNRARIGPGGRAKACGRASAAPGQTFDCMKIMEMPMGPTGWTEAGRSLAERIPSSVLALAFRLAIASVFWRSGRTKVHGLSIREETFVLFREEYRVPLLPPDLAAYMTTAAEHVLPILLVIGFASRLSAFGLLGMTLVIQFFVYPSGWPQHILWIALLLQIVARGPGALSLDHLIWSRRQTAGTPRVPAAAQ
jgi:putative oxidoreductase